MFRLASADLVGFAVALRSFPNTRLTIDWPEVERARMAGGVTPMRFRAVFRNSLPSEIARAAGFVRGAFEASREPDASVPIDHLLDALLLAQLLRIKGAGRAPIERLRQPVVIAASDRPRAVVKVTAMPALDGRPVRVEQDAEGKVVAVVIDPPPSIAARAAIRRHALRAA